jgi:hypothetical protein
MAMAAATCELSWYPPPEGGDGLKDWRNPDVVDAGFHRNFTHRASPTIPGSRKAWTAIAELALHGSTNRG